MMNSRKETEQKGENPGAGAGMADDFAPGVEERMALERNAGHPGSADNAAGMHGGSAGDKKPESGDNASAAKE